MIKEMERCELKEQIDIKREELNNVVNTEIVPDKALEISVELDELIVKYTRLDSNYSIRF
ncbi:MAG: aspartyl-phosphate phosphatase Spo0E family protein [Tissierellia bacterium]|nr:aspartyl-phosphate phosphatase Spo0E family protein [Tissierellia bacterium]MDD4725319.1 aspartyl-phosphate phosphatase Spo0E family protein [Tissierellia bacterium]